MLPLSTAFTSPMARRLLVVVTAALACVLLAVVLLDGRDAAIASEEAQLQRLDEASRAFADVVATRLSAGAAVARAYADRDAGADAQALRARVQATEGFDEVLLLPPVDRTVARPDGLGFEFTSAQLAALRKGATIIAVGRGGDAPAALFALQPLRAAGSPRVAAFRFAADGLWRAPASAARPAFHAVAAPDVALHDVTGAARELHSLFAAQIGTAAAAAGVERAPHRLAWQSGGRSWVGAGTVLVPLHDEVSTPVVLVAAANPPPVSSGFAAALRRLPLLMLLAGSLALAATLMVMQAWLPAVRALRRGLTDLRSQRAAPLRELTARDEPRALLEQFNQTSAVVLKRDVTLRALAEIDAMLLSSGDLEQVLDGVLVRMREVTRCRALGVALVDGKAAAHARLFIASREGGPLPVARVEIDPSIADTLQLSPEGLTIARCEDERHSFLAPLRGTGAQFFWVWPVLAAERLVAILAVGFEHPSQAEAELAGWGTQCARRLAVALSSSARAETLYRQAHFDTLTQLPNRLLFRDRMSQELAAVAADASRGALLYIDLDHFKKINDSLGHEAGDQVLAITAQRLRACVKEGDTVARLGGDEFTAILRQVTDPPAAAAVAERIIESLQLPVNLGGNDHHVRASIGITLYPDDGGDIEELMRNADLAMYRAKSLGRGAAVFFDRRMIGREAAALDSGLHRALKRREFSLFYQPQYALSDGRLVGVEALLRWQSARDGFRAPLDFVPAAEESGLIVDIGSWVLEAACAQLAAWRAQGLAPPRMAVNIAPQQLRDREFAAQVRRLLDKHGLDGDMLEIELTEAALTEGEAEDTLADLARLGVGLTLDDFGTGYSALGHLRRYPVRAVKIDRSFIEEAPGNAASATLAETIILMAHNLGKRVVAEGVETLEQLDFLRERGCDVAQGYYLARPLAAAAMAELLEGRLGNGWDAQDAVSA